MTDVKQEGSEILDLVEAIRDQAEETIMAVPAIKGVTMREFTLNVSCARLDADEFSEVLELLHPWWSDHPQISLVERGDAYRKSHSSYYLTVRVVLA